MDIRCCPFCRYVRSSFHGLVMFSPVFREKGVVFPVVGKLYILVDLLVVLFVLFRHFVRALRKW